MSVAILRMPRQSLDYSFELSETNRNEVDQIGHINEAFTFNESNEEIFTVHNHQGE